MNFAHLRKDMLAKTANAVHKTLVAVSGGRIGSTVGDLPVVKLTTTGRKSGQARTVMLTAPIHGDGRWVLVASKGGDDRDPDWYRNLVANPRIILEPIGGDGPIELTARTTVGEERTELWSKLARSPKGYAAYQKKTDRDIPVIVCEPSG